jgi:hypothetical protein
MITLYSYPTLFGVADNNGYGLKVFAFLRLVSAMHDLFGKPASTFPDHAAGLPFVHEHIFDASKAPRGQLPISSMTARRSATAKPLSLISPANMGSRSMRRSAPASGT